MTTLTLEHSMDQIFGNSDIDDDLDAFVAFDALKQSAQLPVDSTQQIQLSPIVQFKATNNGNH
jgi:hypothetical protein